MREVILTAHRRGYEAIKAVRGDFPLGLTLALHDFQAAPGGESKVAEMRGVIADAYLERLRGNDFVGVQNYARMVIGADGIVHPGGDVEVNQMGEEIYPEALGGAVRYAAEVSGCPVYVTENGLATTDDAQRVAYFQRALASLAECMQAGVDVRGYLCWSALDNFEWVGGYHPVAGIIEIDRATQTRYPQAERALVGERRPHRAVVTQR